MPKRGTRNAGPAVDPLVPVTLRSVADAAGVHVSTASRALDPEQAGRITPATVARVKEAAERLGYTPDLVAAGLKRRRTGTVGVIVSDFDNPYSPGVVRGISTVLEQHGLVVLVTETLEDPARLDRILKHLVSRRVDAVVTTAVHHGDGELLTAIRRAGIPVVLAGRSLPGSDLPAVVSDDFQGGSLAAAHLVELGHRVLAQLLGPADIDTFDRRRRGFRSQLADDGPRDVSVALHARAPTLAEGRRLMRATLAGDTLPTGVFAHNDLMAVGAMEAVAAAGLSCPDDVSIVGFDDVSLASHIAPPLTTIRVATEELGRSAGWLALQLISDSGTRPEDVRLPVLLVTRESTAPATRRRAPATRREVAGARRR